MVRAKFRVTSKTTNEYAQSIEMHPVTGPSEENKAFFKATPNGRIDLGTINSDAADQFIVGKEYYIDFTPADGGAIKSKRPADWSDDYQGPSGDGIND